MDQILALFNTELRAKRQRVLGSGAFGTAFLVGKHIVIKIGASQHIVTEINVHREIWKHLTPAERVFFCEPLHIQRVLCHNFASKYPHIADLLSRALAEEVPYRPCAQMFVQRYAGANYKPAAELPKTLERQFRVQLAQALAAIHRVGYAHTDIHRNNVLFQITRNGYLHVKVIDFGLAVPLWYRIAPGQYLHRPGIVSHNNVALGSPENMRRIATINPGFAATYAQNNMRMFSRTAMGKYHRAARKIQTRIRQRANQHNLAQHFFANEHEIHNLFSNFLEPPPPH